MPYIKKDRRFMLDEGMDTPQNCGELNYNITKMIVAYLRDKKESYQTYNDILGVLTAIQYELYERKIVTYEAQKCTQNGDVF